MEREKNEPNASASAGGEHYPILGQVRAFPGLFAGTLGAIAVFAVGIVLPEVVPAMSTTNALVVAAPLAGLIFGIGTGWDDNLPSELAQRLQPVGFALLVLPFLVGLASGPQRFALSWISVAALAHAVSSIAAGQKLSGADPESPQF